VAFATIEFPKSSRSGGSHSEARVGASHFPTPGPASPEDPEPSSVLQPAMYICTVLE
jgi:hypothetical protein